MKSVTKIRLTEKVVKKKRHENGPTESDKKFLSAYSKNVKKIDTLKVPIVFSLPTTKSVRKINVMKVTRYISI